MQKKNVDRKIAIVASHAASLINFRGDLIKTLCKAGIEVHAIAPGIKDDINTYTQLESWGVVTYDIAMQRTGLNPINDTRTIFSLYRLLLRIKPYAVLAYTVKPVIYGILAAWLAKVPKRYALITGLGYAFSGKAVGRRAVVLNLVRRLYSMAIHRSHHVLFQNPDDQALFKELGILPSSVPSTVVNGSGVDTSYFYYASLPKGSTSFLLTARLIADKGIRFYAEAAKKLKKRYPNSMFYLAGDLDANPESIKQIELNEWISSGSIEYLGKLDDVRTALSNSHVFVLPTYYREGVPRTILEALSMGRAIITTDTPGCRETVAEDKNGYLVPIKDVEALMLAMERLIVQPELSTLMGVQSRAIAEEKYDVHKVNAVMLSVMEISYPKLTQS